MTQYVRTSDGFATEATRTTTDADGNRLPAKVMIDNQYQGMRPLSDYLLLFAAPFFRTLSLPVLFMVVAGTVGYWSGRGLGRLLPAPPAEPRKRIRGTVSLAWLLWLIALFVLTYGINGLDALGLGLLLARFVWLSVMYFAGMNLDQPWGRPTFTLLFLFGLVQSIVGEGLLTKLNAALSGQNGGGGIIVAVISVGVWLLAGFYAARMGRSARERWGSRRTKALIITVILWVVVFVGTILVLNAIGTTQNVLPVSDTRRWGRLFTDAAADDCRYPRIVPAGRTAGAGTAEQPAGGEMDMRDLHRTGARRAVHHGAVHGRSFSCRWSTRRWRKSTMCSARWWA